MEDLYDSDDAVELREYAAAIEREISDALGVPFEDVQGLTADDIEQLANEAAEGQDEIDAVGEATARSMWARAGYDDARIAREQYQEKLDAAVAKARRGEGWSEYLALKRERSDNVDTSGAQTDSRPGADAPTPLRLPWQS